MPRTAHRHEQPLRKEEDDGAKGNEGLAASITCPSYYHIDNTADQSYALGAMRISSSSSSSRNDELSPTSTTTMTHQRTNTQGSKDSPDGGDFKSGGVAQRPDHTFYVDGEVGDDNAVLASTNNIDGEEGSIRAGVVYRTYKRRWFGLVQLTLLNIIVSWDVSIILRLLPLRAPSWILGLSPTNHARFSSYRIPKGMWMYVGRDLDSPLLYILVYVGARCDDECCYMRANILVGCDVMDGQRPIRSATPTNPKVRLALQSPIYIYIASG